MRPAKEKIYLIEIYKKLAKELSRLGYDSGDLAVIFNRDKSVVFRAVNEEEPIKIKLPPRKKDS